MEQANGIGPPADGCNKQVRQTPLDGQYLFLCFCADHRLKIAHHFGIGMRAGSRADQVIGIVHIGDPVAQGFIHCILERSMARRDRNDLCAQQFHAKHVG